MRRSIQAFRTIQQWLRSLAERGQAAVQAMIAFWQEEERGFRRSISEHALRVGDTDAAAWQSLRHNSRVYSRTLVPDGIKAALAVRLYARRSEDFRAALRQYFSQRQQQLLRIGEVKGTIEQLKKAGWPPRSSAHALALQQLGAAKSQLRFLNRKAPVFSFEPSVTSHRYWGGCGAEAPAIGVDLRGGGVCPPPPPQPGPCATTGPRVVRRFVRRPVSLQGTARH